MIDVVRLEERSPQQPEKPAQLDLMRCARCGGGLARVHLTVGSYAELRCHHTIQLNGKRVTCGWVTRAWPTR